MATELYEAISAMTAQPLTDAELGQWTHHAQSEPDDPWSPDAILRLLATIAELKRKKAQMDLRILR